MKRKTAPQEAWEKLTPWEVMTDSKLIRRGSKLTRAQFNRIWQLAYRRGMERAAGVAEATREPIGKWTEATSKSAAWHIGRNGAARRIRDFVKDGAKDE